MAHRPNKIAHVRKSLGMSQQELADKIGAHSITISNLERGKAALTGEWLERLASALQVDEIALLNEERPERVYVAGEITAKSIEFWPHDQNYAVALGKTIPMSADVPKWLILRDDSLYPVFRAMDVVRVIPVLEYDRNEVKWAFGRLCIVKVKTRPTTIVGYLNPASRQDQVSIDPLSGPSLLDVTAELIYVIDRAIYQPEFPAPTRSA